MEYFITHVSIDLMVNPTVTFEVLENNPSRIGAKKNICWKCNYGEP